MGYVRQRKQRSGTPELEKGNVETSDVVEIVCTEIDAYDPPCAKEEKNMYTTATDIDPVLRERMLQRYYRLKKILEEEGLL